MATTNSTTGTIAQPYRPRTTGSERKFVYWALGAAVVILAAVIYMFTQDHEVRPLDSGRTDSQQMGNAPNPPARN